MWYWMVAFLGFLHCVLLPFIFMLMQLGIRFFCLHVLLYQIAVLHLHSFSMVFLYLFISFACWAVVNLTLYVLCIVINYINKPTRYTFYVSLYNSTWFERLFRSSSGVRNLLYLLLCTNHSNVPNCSVLQLELHGLCRLQIQ